MKDLSLVLWAIIPPLVFLWSYYRRISAPPSPLQLLCFFLLGAISGFVALGLEWVVDIVANSVINWAKIQRYFLGFAVGQLVVIGPVEEGCKFAAVIIPISYFQRSYRLRPITVFMFTLAAALGFTAEENWLYWFHGTSPILERIISTPVHSMFVAPWGYALGRYIFCRGRLNKDKILIFTSWFNSVFFHALVNILSRSWVYPAPISFLGYCLFPFLLWLFWRLEQFWLKSQGKHPIKLISGHTLKEIFREKCFVLVILMFGGNAIFRIFILVRKVSALPIKVIFDNEIILFIFKEVFISFSLAFVAWFIYRYLRYLSRQRFLLKCSNLIFFDFVRV